MDAQHILSASYLDLLFEHRNKQYGAYVLRRYYPQRLQTAVGVMLLLVLLASVWLLTRPLPQPMCAVPVTLMTDHYLEPPPKSPPVKTVAPVSPRIKQASAPKAAGAPPVSFRLSDVVDSSSGDATMLPGIVGGDASGTVTNGPAGAPAAVTVAVVPEPEKPVVFERSEIPPVFPGGPEAWINYLRRMLRQPGDLEPGDKRTVTVRFVVNADGSISDAVVMQSGGVVLDKEVLRVLYRMPRWQPGMQNGHAVAVYFVQPVTFQAPDE